MNQNGDENDIDRSGPNFEDFDDDLGNENLEEGQKRNYSIESYAVGGNNRFGSKFGVIYSDQYSKDMKADISSTSRSKGDSSAGYLETFTDSSRAPTTSMKETFSSSKSPGKPLIRSVRNSGLQLVFLKSFNISLSAFIILIISQTIVYL